MKRFILDTNVLLYDSRALLSFGKNEIVLPIDVLEELDKFKRVDDELGRNARAVIRELDNLRHKGDFSSGVVLDNGGILRIPAFLDLSLAKGLGISSDSADNRMLMTTYVLQKQFPLEETILISKDINLRVKANAFGIRAEDYIKEHIEVSDLYSGWREVCLPSEEIDKLFENGEIDRASKKVPGLLANQFVLIRENTDSRHSALGIYKQKVDKILPLNNKNSAVWSIRPRNKEQAMAFHLLLDDSIKLVTLLGPAGTGKTLLALAAGLHKVVDEELYNRLLISRPVMPLGRDIGFLPGSKEEKLSNWMGPIYDNLEFILNNKQGKRKRDISVDIESFIEEGIIEMEALTYMRGRSIPSQFILIDEAQNLSPHEIKTIISRVGEKSKIVLTGDPYQIDSPYLDAVSNGLSYCIERLKGQGLFGHILLSKSERSDVASLAAKFL